MNIIIHAPNVHQGGGRILLSGLISAKHDKCGKVVILDARMDIPQDTSGDITIKKVNPSVIQRLLAEWWLATNTKPEDVILCFGNLPPLFRLRGHTFIFVQNRYLVENASTAHFPLKTRLRISIERCWFSWRASNADVLIAQTPSMKFRINSRLGTKVPVRVMPYVCVSESEKDTQASHIDSNNHTPDYDFLYVASGERHKNHHLLIESWCRLADDGIYPSLCLTIDAATSPDLCRWINERKAQHGLNVTNLGWLPHSQVKKLYHQARALIYPSKFESFGLPLIEAKQAGLPVLAAELDYVRDLVDPQETFDPESAISISRAVKRFMRIDEQPLQLLGATEFINHLLER